MNKTILVAFGTRPEVIKLYPVIRALSAKTWAHVHILHTGQHADLVRGLLRELKIVPDIRFRAMQKNGTLTSLTTRLLQNTALLFSRQKPDMVIVQGDTTTAFATALSAYYHQIPVVHVEAGLRTYDPMHPFPEELNRQMIARLATIHAAPTKIARTHLLREGILKNRIVLAGNTVVDTLFLVQNELSDSARTRHVLITVHRRENQGSALREIFSAIKRLAIMHPEILFRFPVHPSPMVRETAYRQLSGVQNISLEKPLGYQAFIRAIVTARCVITDSGGVQEESAILGVPVLVLRTVTERPEGVTAGIARLIGVTEERIVNEIHKQLTCIPTSHANPSKIYGDGNASERIVNAISQYFFPPDGIETK